MVTCIIGVVGASGSGKTSIINRLHKRYPRLFNIVNSCTERPKRHINEQGHLFLSKEGMDIVYNSNSVVAKTVYGGYRYCSIIHQFDEYKANLYVVDNQGVKDLKEYFKGEDYNVLIVKIIRHNINVDEDRINRDTVIDDSLVDFTITNNSSLSCAVMKFMMKLDFQSWLYNERNGYGI